MTTQIQASFVRPLALRILLACLCLFAFTPLAAKAEFLGANVEYLIRSYATSWSTKPPPGTGPEDDRISGSAFVISDGETHYHSNGASSSATGSSSSSSSTLRYRLTADRMVVTWSGSASARGKLWEETGDDGLPDNYAAAGQSSAGWTFFYTPTIMGGGAVGTEKVTLPDGTLGVAYNTIIFDGRRKQVSDASSVNPVQVAAYALPGEFGTETDHSSRSYYYSFTLDGTPVPGESPDDPLPGDRLPIPEENVPEIQQGCAQHGLCEEELAAPANDVTGSYLTTPFPVESGGLGDVQTAYAETEVAFGNYFYVEEGANAFKSFEIPAALPQGDSQFELHYLGQSYPLTAGQTFDFTALDPNGVDSFILAGIDETELIGWSVNPPETFVYGATFMNTDLVTGVSSVPLVPLPGDFDLDGDVDDVDLGSWEAGYGVGSLHSQGDANGDALVGGTDFLRWQQHFDGALGPLASSQAVPEPQSATLIACGLLGGLFYRRKIVRGLT